MNAARLSFLRYLAFWNAMDKQGLSPTHPDVREVETFLNRDFMEKMRVVKVSDIN